MLNPHTFRQRPCLTPGCVICHPPNPSGGQERRVETALEERETRLSVQLADYARQLAPGSVAHRLITEAAADAVRTERAREELALLRLAWRDELPDEYGASDALADAIDTFTGLPPAPKAYEEDEGSGPIYCPECGAVFFGPGAWCEADQHDCPAAVKCSPGPDDCSCSGPLCSCIAGKEACQDLSPDRRSRFVRVGDSWFLRSLFSGLPSAPAVCAEEARS
jgi:hypothetical protein